MMRVEAGCFRLGPCAFITVTYRVASDTPLRNAASVAKDWRALWRKWKYSEPNQLHWLRVIELTKKGQPHLHVIVGPTVSRIRCYGSTFDVQTFKKRFYSCDCLSHRLSRMWWATTGDSWIVHAVPVAGARGAARYLAKYLTKQESFAPLLAAGFSRRWSRSRGFPAGGRLRLRTSIEENWRRTEISHRYAWSVRKEPYGALELNDPVGDDLVVLLAARNQRQGIRAAAYKLLGGQDAEANSPEDFPYGGGSGS